MIKVRKAKEKAEPKRSGRKSTLLALLIFIIGSLAGGCYRPEEILRHNFDKQQLIDTRLKQMVEDMSLQEKIAQMLIVSYDTKTYSGKIQQDFLAYQPGGFILFSNNIESKKQVKKLIAGMQADSKIPLFIATDQEGGRVQRIKNNVDRGVANIPAMGKVGKRNDKQYAYQIGQTLGQQLKDFDVNMDLAPCLDIADNPKNSVIGDRSFGSKPELVIQLGLKVASGIVDCGVITVYKHFPGHGSTTADPHFALPVQKKSREELQNWELLPFIAAIQAGADAVMVGHIAVPDITGDDTPASLSPEIINELLRNQLGYEGLVMTDGLDMKALTKNYSKNQIIIKAINAGNDVLLLPGDPAQVVAIVEKAVEEKTIAVSTLDTAVYRILQLKYRYGILKLRYFPD